MKNARLFGRAFFVGAWLYSPPPKRRDHQPARRGAAGVSAAASGAGSGAAAAGGAIGSGAAATGAAGSLLDRKLTFSRTVERRRDAFSSLAGSSSTTAADGAGWAGVSTGA
jgi:hypothetical protein